MQSAHHQRMTRPVALFTCGPSGAPSCSHSHSLASRIGREVSTFGRVRPLSERLAAIEAVTAADVRRVAQTYLLDEKRTVVHVVAPPAGQGGVLLEGHGVHLCWAFTSGRIADSSVASD